MTKSDLQWQPNAGSVKLAVLQEQPQTAAASRALAHRLAIPLLTREQLQGHHPSDLLICWRDAKLCLLDPEHFDKGGLAVDFDVDAERQRSWPAPKKGPLAQAVGRKTRTVIDATAGWGQDSFFIFRMGYEVVCIERSPVMAELLHDGLSRLSLQPWMQRLSLLPPRLLHGNAIEVLKSLDFIPDCIYLDPMFPPKRKQSARARKSMALLRQLLGDDADRELLFQVALSVTGKRVVVKSPDYAAPLGGKADESFKGKLVRYDVYFK